MVSIEVVAMNCRLWDLTPILNNPDKEFPLQGPTANQQKVTEGVRPMAHATEEGAFCQHVPAVGTRPSKCLENWSSVVVIPNSQEFLGDFAMCACARLKKKHWACGIDFVVACSRLVSDID